MSIGIRIGYSSQSNHGSRLNSSNGGVQGFLLGFSGLAGKCDKNYWLGHGVMKLSQVEE